MVNAILRFRILFISTLALMVAVGCGPEERGTVQIVFNLADGEANAQLLSSEDLFELEIVVEGDPLTTPIRKIFKASPRSARIPSLPAGQNYRVSVFGLNRPSGGMTESSFYGSSGLFDVDGSSVTRVPVQLGRADCISPNNIAGINPDGGAFDMVEKRDGFATAVLPDGRVLIIGGGEIDQTRRVNRPKSTIEVFDPLYGDFRLLDFQLSTPRAYHTATTLADGSVLVFGGITGENGGTVATNAELIYPDADFPIVPVTLENQAFTRYHHEAVRLDDGSVLIAGGYDNAFNLTATVIRYFPDGRIVPQGPLSSPRAHGAMARTSIAGYPAAYASGLTDNALSETVELFSTLEGQGVDGNGLRCNDGSTPGDDVGCFVDYEDLAVPRSHFEMLSTYRGKELLFIGGYTDVVASQTTNIVERFRQKADGGLMVERVGELPFATAELAAHAVTSPASPRGSLQTYLVAGGRDSLSVSNGAVRIEESPFENDQEANYVITSLEQECRLPEARANLVMVSNESLPLLLIGGHRYDGEVMGWAATARAEVYFPSFKAIVGQ
ncbi:MAG: kelch repeat-containing protein [Bradymonadia bacterium]